MTSSFAIRLAETSDAKPLSEFAARLFRSTYGSHTPAEDLEAYIGKRFGPESQEAEITDRNGATFLAIADEAIVGYAHVIAGNDHAALLNRIYLDTSWRGSGLAKALLDAVIAESKGRGIRQLELTVFERNLRAMAFYRRVGFVATGRTTFMVGEEAQVDVRMELNLVELWP